MTLHVGMIADDLTGALDAAAPFAEQGLKTIVVLSHDGLQTADPVALASAEVICINTASRELSVEIARARVVAATVALLKLAPEMLFKKIDSRLKGHIAAELAAMLEASGRADVIVAPAIPDLGRIVVDGAVIGMGVDVPINVLERCGGLPVTIPDTPDAAGLNAVAYALLGNGKTTLAAGARGLAQALAQQLPSRPPRRFSCHMPQPALIAIGSRDPITRTQIDRAVADVRPQRLMAPNGDLPLAPLSAAVTLVTAEAGSILETGRVVADRFAKGIANLVENARPASLLMSGGETAYAILKHLDVVLIDLGGEALPGIPFASALIRGEQVVILTKSGGFGSPDTISLLVGGPADLN